MQTYLTDQEYFKTLSPGLSHVLLHSGDLSMLFEAFNRFIIKQSTNNATWRFWKDFIFTDFTAYLALYVAIRTHHWTLRMAGLKEMAPTL